MNKEQSRTIAHTTIRWLAFVIIGIVVLCGVFLAPVVQATEYRVTYQFQQPTVSALPEGTVIVTLPGTWQDDSVIGAPRLPVKTSNVFIPADEQISSITVTPGTLTALGGTYVVQHATTPYPYSYEGPLTIDNPDPAIYATDANYPSVVYEERGQQWYKGIQVVQTDLRPVLYNPVQQRLQFYPDMQVIVNTAAAKNGLAEQSVFRNVTADRTRILDLIDNDADFLRSSPDTSTATASKTSRRYVIITTQAMTAAFQQLANFRQTAPGGGFTTHIETIENIAANYTGVDLAEKMRNFIKNSYTQYGTEYVVLGGDSDGPAGSQVIPTRGCTVEIGSYTDTNIPSDLYFGCLDGNWNNDGDARWCEPNDGVNGGDIDWLSEVYVGRIAADNAAEAQNQITKIIAFETSSPAYKTLLAGEYLWGNPLTWGGDRLDWVSEAMCALPRETLYDRDWPGHNWPKAELINQINANDVTWLNHLGHSNVTYNMKMDSSDVAALTNTNFMFVYSQGCYSGALDGRDPSRNYLSSDAFGEVMTNAYPDRGAFAYIGNSRYGWFEAGAYVKSASNLAHQQFMEAMFGNCSGSSRYKQLGAANQESKIKLDRSYWLYRWIAFETNLIGDPATMLLYSALPTLTVMKAGTGSGTVTSTPSGIECGTACAKSYAAGTAVTLTATADAYSEFTGWTGGGCSGVGTCTVTLNGDVTVTATFGVKTIVRHLNSWEVDSSAPYFNLESPFDYNGHLAAKGTLIDPTGKVHIAYGDDKDIRYAVYDPTTGVWTDMLVATTTKGQQEPMLTRNDRGIYLVSHSWQYAWQYAGFADSALYFLSNVSGSSWVKLTDIYTDRGFGSYGPNMLTNGLFVDPEGDIHIILVKAGWWTYGSARREQIYHAATGVLGPEIAISERTSGNPDANRNQPFREFVQRDADQTLTMPMCDGDQQALFFSRSAAPYGNWVSQTENALSVPGCGWFQPLPAFQDADGNIHALFINPNTGEMSYSYNWSTPVLLPTDMRSLSADLVVMQGKVYVVFSQYDSANDIVSGNLFLMVKDTSGVWQAPIQLTHETQSIYSVWGDGQIYIDVDQFGFAHPFGYREEPTRLYVSYTAFDGTWDGNVYRNSHIHVQEIMSETTHKLYGGIGNQLVEMNETGSITRVLESGLTWEGFYFPVIDVRENAIWVNAVDADRHQSLRKYSLTDYTLKVKIDYPAYVPPSESNPYFYNRLNALTQAPDGTLYVGIVTGYPTGKLFKIWGTDAELNGYQLSGDSGAHHALLTTDVGTINKIDYQAADNTILVASGDTHRWKKFSATGQQLLDIPSNWGHTGFIVGSSYANAWFGSCSTNLKKFDFAGNVLFTIPKCGSGHSIWPTSQGGLISTNRDSYTVSSGPVSKYDASGNELFSTSALQEASLQFYEEQGDSQTIWVTECAGATWAECTNSRRMIKIWGTDSELNGYDLTPLTGSHHQSFLANITSSRIVVVKQASSSPFTDVPEIGSALADVAHGATGWFDANNDGRLDLLVTGQNSAGQPFAEIYRNDGNNQFTPLNAGLTGVSASAAAFGDLDNDLDIDLLLVGQSAAGRVSYLYRNDNGAFVRLNITLPGVTDGTAALADFTGDGKQDIVLSGMTATGSIAKVFRNNGNGSFTEITNAGLTGVYQSAVAVADWNRDGALDVLLAGRVNAASNPITKLYQNNGSGVFSAANVSLPGVMDGAAALADIDHDSDLDVLLAGLSATGPIAKLYRNNGSGSFAEAPAGLRGVSQGTLVSGDIDNDGDADLGLIGLDASNTLVASVYRQNNDGTFTEIAAGLTGASQSAAAFGDYDRDGDLDLIITGLAADATPVSTIYRNNAASANTVATTPTNVQITIENNKLVVRWNPSTDEQTPQDGLTYALCIGTAPDRCDLLSPMANLATGDRRIPQPGTISDNSLGGTGCRHESFLISALPTGIPLYARVQAIDAAFAGSPFSGGNPITIDPPQQFFILWTK